jgi:hypothetical protein
LRAGGRASKIAAVAGPRMKILLAAALVVAFLFCLGTGGAQAAFTCWSNGAGGNWSNPGNWRNGLIPGPNDEATLNATGSGCNQPESVTVDTDVTVGVLSSPFTKIQVAAGKTLAVVGNAGEAGTGPVVLGAGSKLNVPTGAVMRPSGAIEMDPTAEFDVEGTVHPINQLLTLGGTVDFGSGSHVILDSQIMTLGSPTNRTKVDLQGSVNMSNGYKGGVVFLYPTADSPPSAASWTGPADSLIAARMVNGQAFSMSGPIGVGGIELTDGQLHLIGNEPCAMVGLKLFSPAVINLDSGRSCAVSGKLDMSNESQFGGRSGAGTLVAATADLTAGRIDGGGLTRVTGAATIGGNSPTTIRDGATLRTEGATAWGGGWVQLGAPGEAGTWENAGTLTVDNSRGGLAPALQDGGGTGVLRNLAGATLARQAPLGEFTAAARIENAGTIDVRAGTFGKAGDAGTIVQSAGVTHVAAGAVLDQAVTMNGGALSGAGTVREVANSGGTVAPGDSRGTLSIAGAYTQGAGGTLETEVAGTTPGSFDQLAVGGAATLAGTLKIVRAAEFTPALADTFKVLQAGSRSGEFAALAGDTTAPGGLVFGATYAADGATLCFAGGGLCPGTPPPSGPSGPETGNPSGPGDSGSPGTGTTPGSGSTPGSGTTPGSGSGSGTGGGSGGGTPRPTTPDAPGAKTVAIGTIASLPSAKTCVSRGSFKFQLRLPKGMKVASAEIQVNGKTVTVKGKGLTSPVTLKNLPQGKFTLQITLIAADGSKVTGKRAYPACGSKPARKKKAPKS